MLSNSEYFLKIGKMPSVFRRNAVVSFTFLHKATIIEKSFAKSRRSSYAKSQTKSRPCRRAGGLYSDGSRGGHCGSGLFFSGAKPYIGQQHFRLGDRAVQLCAAAAVCHHNDFKRCAVTDRLFDLRARVWRQNRVHQHSAAVFHRCAGARFPKHRFADRQPGAGCAVLHSGGQRRAEHPV